MSQPLLLTYDSKTIGVVRNPYERLVALYQQSFDFDDEKLRNKYPALQDAWEHYQNIKQMCETREKEEDAS